MTKAELLKKITDNGYQILQEKYIAGESGIDHIAVAVAKKEGDVLNRKWIHFYVEGDLAYWQDRDPFFVKPVVKPTVEEIKAKKLADLITKAKEIRRLINVGIEEESTITALKTEYTNLTK